jgi:hypothetical protein
LLCTSAWLARTVYCWTKSQTEDAELRRKGRRASFSKLDQPARNHLLCVKCRILTLGDGSLHLSSIELKRRTQTRFWARVSWTCAVFLLLVNSVQAAHACGLAEGSRAHQRESANSSDLRSGDAQSEHTFCMICASSRLSSSPAPSASLPYVIGLSEYLPSTPVIEPFASPKTFALFIRPPPLF